MSRGMVHRAFSMPHDYALWKRGKTIYFNVALFRPEGQTLMQRPQGS
jgi:hypothetical protein